MLPVLSILEEKGKSDSPLRHLGVATIYHLHLGVANIYDRGTNDSCAGGHGDF
jgi:hypothetical protein